MWMTHCSLLVLAASAIACAPKAPQPSSLEAKAKGEAPVRAGGSLPLTEASAVVGFWKEAGPSLWFAKDPAFDRRFRERFAAHYQAAAHGALDGWLDTPEGALALCVLLDQYPRNSFRGTPRMYATDEKARRIADMALRAGHDLRVEPALSLFMYLPFGHSESLADQERSVALSQRLGQPSIQHAEGHRDIIRRFGRFPHRNPILGRSMKTEEQRFLDEGGFKG